MDYCDLILNNSSSNSCEIILWELKDEKLLVKYSNKHLLLIGTTLDEYFSREKCVYKYLYDNIIFNKLEQNIIVNNYNINIKYLDNNLYCEYKYIINNNNFLLYAVSNKIKDPINDLVGALAVISYEGDKNKENKENKDSKIDYLEIVRDSTMKLVTIANDLIDIVNLENSKIILEKQEVYIKHIVPNIYKIISSRIKEKKLNFTYKLSDLVPESINIDVERLTQLIVNLVDNSIDNMQSGTISLEITLFTSKVHGESSCPFVFVGESSNTSNILFKIKDTGDGLDTDKIEEINKILNISSNPVKLYKYYGFGLTICRDLAVLMGGNVWFKTEKDIGSVFYFNIIC